MPRERPLVGSVEDHRGVENQCPRAELRRKVENSVRKGRRAGRDEGTPGPKTPQVPRPAGAPYWLPVGPFWDRLAEGVRRAVGEILEPAYRRLVVEARDELERGERLASPPGAGPALPAPPLAQTRARQDPSGYRIVGPDFPPPPELICGSEEPGIGKS